MIHSSISKQSLRFKKEKKRKSLSKMVMDILGFITLAVVGFTSCAEFGSYVFVHPVIRRLPTKDHIRVEQGLLKTCGSFMALSVILLCLLRGAAERRLKR